MTAMSCGTQPRQAPVTFAPTVTMYSVVVELRDWTGCTENKLGFGPKVAKSTLEAPEVISDLLSTQNWAP